jgi:trigger factor
MPTINIEEKEKATIKITFTVSQEEARPYLEEAAVRLCKQTPIPGFRPGKADFEMVKQRFGEMKLLEEALEPIIRKSYVEAVLAKNLETVGSPKIDVEKLAPGNDIVFTAEVARMPKALSLTDYKKLTVTSKPVEVTDKEIDIALGDIQKMQTKEIRIQTGMQISGQNKVVLSMSIKKDGVAIDGGQSPNHAIYLSEDYYIPGFKEQLIGMKEGDQKTFTLPFPKEHVQKMLAGNDVDFDVAIKEIYNLEPPTIDDVFASSIGMKDLKELKEKIDKNLRDEKDVEETTRQEKEMFELLVKKSQFEEIPDLLLNEEINKMIDELKRNVESQGLEFETYVSNLKKTLAQLKIDFTPQALTRIKVAIALRSVAQKENVELKDDEVDAELDRLAEHYEDPEMKKRVYEPTFREYIERVLVNRKTISLLKQIMVKV